MGEHNLTLQRIIFIWLKYFNFAQSSQYPSGGRRTASQSQILWSPMITIASDPEAHVSLLTGFAVDTPSLLFYFYFSPLTFFSPLFYSVVYPVFPSLRYFLLFPSPVLWCPVIVFVPLGGGWHPYSYPYLPRLSRGGHSAKAPRPVEGVWFRHRGGPTAPFPSGGALGWLGRHVPWVWQVA